VRAQFAASVEEELVSRRRLLRRLAIDEIPVHTDGSVVEAAHPVLPRARDPRATTVNVRVVRCAALLALGATPAAAQKAQPTPASSTITVQAGAVVDKDTVTVGDVVRLTVRVRAPLGSTVNFPTGLDSLARSRRSSRRRCATAPTPAWSIGRHVPALAVGHRPAADPARRRDRAGGRRRPARGVDAADAVRAERAARRQRAARAEARAPCSACARRCPGGGGRSRRSPRSASVCSSGGGSVAAGAWRDRDPFADAEAAFARIERLRLPEAGEPGRHAALMTDVVRRYLAERHDAATLAHTSGELLAAMAGVQTVPFERLQRLLNESIP
jgi:hypothetical protein